MKIYAESSAVLSWLFDEPVGSTVASILANAETVVVSELTIVECQRVIRRAVAAGDLTESESHEILAALKNVVDHWMRSAVTQEILVTASGAFPMEPIRTLHAIHLATAVRTRNAIPNLKILSLDKQVRENGITLGFEVVPDSED